MGLHPLSKVNCPRYSLKDVSFEIKRGDRVGIKNGVSPPFSHFPLPTNNNY